MDATLGIDFQLSESGDIVFDGSGNLVLINNEANLMQDISLRLQCNYGDYPFDFNYGSDLSSYIGRLMNVSNQHNVQTSAITSLSRDPRILQITKVLVSPGEFTGVTVEYADISGRLTSQEVSF